MFEFTISKDGLLQINAEVLSSVVHKEPIHGVYDVEKTPLGR